ncbi:malonate decarboxylase subunit epsilon [Glaciimonas immobilis]|uniref:Malonyl CoA-acyl carrier protein transacylase n=1 Tax=Glaciimonas immobilis TaxID=728004 RepID=A0A840RNJ9_9BURK|nr:malonate decarboxylase subunit epsilon [Glaciimonas immobilis]KAF3999086.1 malonate decarboxylase subunit epsilon [Glaciimonas immobilis]MBB5198518.1 malonate decarboxylase epsilon subunit [Glaciimonas immobilis]
MSVLFTFPGQGAQRPGMLHTLPQTPEVLHTLQQAGSILGVDPLLLDTAAALTSTYAVQLCLLIAGVAMARVLIASNAAPDMVAGLSIGAYPAAVIAGALDYADAVRLVQRRGRLMENAYPQGYGMAAINGLDRYQLAAIIATVHSTATPVYLANLNGPRQIVVSGAEDAMQNVMTTALASGATQVVRLAVNVPSHCELFDASALEMQDAFSTITVTRPVRSYLSASATRALFAPQLIATDLANNMATQVHWSETVRLAWERGARLAVEMPSGTVLTNLTAPLFAEGLAIASDNNRLDTLLALISREQNR